MNPSITRASAAPTIYPPSRPGYYWLWEYTDPYDHVDVGHEPAPDAYCGAWHLVEVRKESSSPSFHAYGDDDIDFTIPLKPGKDFWLEIPQPAQLVWRRDVV